MSTMIQCPVCRMQFAAGIAKCPVCGKYEPPREARIAYLGEKAKEAMEKGATADEVKLDFEDAELYGAEVEFAIGDAAKAARATHRRIGLYRIALGLILAVAGALGVRLYENHYTLLILFLGVLLFGAGIVQLILGRHMD